MVTQLRDPVTRVLSAYEFAIEVAARRIKQNDGKFLESAKNTSFVNTLNVWPWSHLVPWFRKSMQIHVSSRKFTQGTGKRSFKNCFYQYLTGALKF